jgi:hypothetical protein
VKFERLLVVVAHSGIILPGEIEPGSLSRDFPLLAKNVDWYTDSLYDFRDLLGNTHLRFPFCSLVLEANRDPEEIESSVPLIDFQGQNVYRSGLEPHSKLRKSLSRKYLQAFHRSIAREIRGGKNFLLDAHSTVSARGVADNQIEIMSYQLARDGKTRTDFCPPEIAETYANALVKRLPGVKISLNASRFDLVYGHVCGRHSINANGRRGSRVPAILQETNQHLYMEPGGTPDLVALETCRRAFAEALFELKRKAGCG